MNKPLRSINSLYSHAWVRDDNTKTIYTQDAMLIALLAHVSANDREGMNGKVVRNLMQDINLED